MKMKIVCLFTNQQHLKPQFLQSLYSNIQNRNNPLLAAGINIDITSMYSTYTLKGLIETK